MSYPDLHRARLAVVHLRKFGWEPIVLRVDPDEQQGLKDPMLADTLPAELETWQAGSIPRSPEGWPGINDVGLRSALHIARLGDQIIRDRRPDVVFFSTTMFPLMALGRYWLARHGVPYVLDFQDPWLSDYRGDSDRIRRSWKFKAAHVLASVLEPFAMRRVSKVVSVSPEYVATLSRRYPRLGASAFTVLPFGASPTDLERAAKPDVVQHHFDPNDGLRHWVYVGRGGTDMARALRAIFAAVRRLRDETLGPFPARLHFIGTNYAADGHGWDTVAPIAADFGLGDVVTEVAARVPYFEALRCLLEADALVVPGSDDSGYSPSKLYPYILANKPLVCVVHEGSLAVKVLNESGAGAAVTFSSGTSELDLVARTAVALRALLHDEAASGFDTEAMRSYLSEAMTDRLSRVLEEAATR